MNELNRKIISRLLAAGVAISLALGGAVAIYGIESIDDQLVSIATAQSARFTDASIQLVTRPESDSNVLHRLAADLVREHFIAVEIYDRQGRTLLEDINPRYLDLARQLHSKAHPFSRDDQPRYEKLMLDGEIVLRVLVPLRRAGGELVGHFEGAFLIDKETLSRLRRELALTLAVVLGAVLLTTLSLYPVILALNKDVMRFSRDLLKANIELMEVLGGAIAKRDSDTSVHNYRVTIYAVKLAEAAKLDASSIRDLVAGAFLHDVGKIGIADAILLKPGKLDEQEFATMKTHVELGLEILKKSQWLVRSKDVVGYHHEKVDGSGYPKGLRGDEIPAIARVFAIVDVFDALTSRRPYKEPMPIDQALAILRQDAGSHFDARLLSTFEAIIEPLFAEINGLPDDAVEEKLRQLIESYFLGEGAKRAAAVASASATGTPATGG